MADSPASWTHPITSRSTCKVQLWGGARWCGAWPVVTYCLHGGYDISNDCRVRGQQNRCTQGNTETWQAGKWYLPHCAAHCVALQSERRLGQRLHVIMTLAGGMQQTKKCYSHTQTDSCHIMPHASTHNAHYNAWNWHNAAAGRIREVEVASLCVSLLSFSFCLPPLTHLTNN